MRNISIVGCGGIGSYLVRNLKELVDSRQFLHNGANNIRVCLYDFDSVEQKNLAYQNFTVDDLYQFKAQTLGDRYGFDFSNKKVSSFVNLVENANDIVVCCVDNIETRVLLYHTYKDSIDIKWIDLRCQGRGVVMYASSKRNTYDYMMTTLPKETDSKESGSCQYAADLNAGLIQNGNRIIAAIGAQTILNMYRGDTFSSRFLQEF